MDEPSLLARITDFASVVLWNWKGLLAGLFLVTGPVLQLLPSRAREWIDNKLPPEPRRRILIGLCLAFLLVSFFQAYDDVSTRLRNTQANNEILKNRWQPLSAQEITSLRLKIRNLKKPPALVVMCNDAGCFDLQQSFLAAVEGLDWNERPDLMLVQPFRGIHISTAHQEYQELANAIEAATNGRLKVQFNHRTTGHVAMDDEVHIAVGRKP
jgi:hypothetical protein